MRCSTVPETDRPTITGHFRIHALLLSARHLIMEITHSLTTARHRLCSGRLLHVTIYVMNSPGSRKSLWLITALYSLHTYRILVGTTPLREIGRGVTQSLVGWSVIGYHKGGL